MKSKIHIYLNVIFSAVRLDSMSEHAVSYKKYYVSI